MECGHFGANIIVYPVSYTGAMLMDGAKLEQPVMIARYARRQ